MLSKIILFVSAVVIAQVSAVGVVTWPMINGNAVTDKVDTTNSPIVLYSAYGPYADAHFQFTTSGSPFPLFTISIVNTGRGIRDQLQVDFDVTTHTLVALEAANYFNQGTPLVDDTAGYQIELMSQSDNTVKYLSGKIGLAKYGPYWTGQTAATTTVLSPTTGTATPTPTPTSGGADTPRTKSVQASAVKLSSGLLTLLGASTFLLA